VPYCTFLSLGVVGAVGYEPVRRLTGSSAAPPAEARKPLAPSERETCTPLRLDERLPLCLSANRGLLGLELCEPIEIGPLVVEQLVLVFENLKFPLDLSGGVSTFRHRRGQLQHMALSAELASLRRWAEPRVRSVVGRLARPVDLWLTQTGVGFGWTWDQGAVTGELHWAPKEDEARLVVDHVRGIDPENAVLGQVLRVLDAILGGAFTRRGRVWLSTHVGRKLSRLLLPAAGARAPSAEGVSFSSLVADGEAARVELDTGLGVIALEPSVVSALELASLVADADDALALGRMAEAREMYLWAVEQAPHHRELVLQVAELDLLAGGREHAALGLVSETLPAVAAGVVGAELLRMCGDIPGAVAALDTAIRNERYSPLLALLHIRKANIDNDIRVRLEALDCAVAAAPTLPAVREVRFGFRANRGDVEGALADAQHLEACASGNRAKLAVCLRCGEVMTQAGFSQPAARFFERALRYRPDNTRAALGLAQSFAALGQPMRAISLLERAVAEADRLGQPEPDARLLLARMLAEKIADLPQAIARVKQIAAGTDTAVHARLWEGRWRLSLGDIVGTSIAWSRMRELIELGNAPAGAAEWLSEAARFERDIKHDLACAERHLAVALRVAPHDTDLLDRYREIAMAVAAYGAPHHATPSEPAR
jgi:tetratricopeptide (TPR) repeat protein